MSEIREVEPGQLSKLVDSDRAPATPSGVEVIGGSVDLVYTQPAETASKPTDPGSPDTDTPEEVELLSNFARLVAGLQVEQTLHLMPDRKVPKSIGEYRFAAITSPNPPLSSTAAGMNCQPPADVRCHYGGEDAKPYIDSSYAIGLVYRGTLAAVAGAFMTKDGDIKVVQLQGLHRDGSDSKQKYKTGLHGGFYWRDTLVQAWIEVAQGLGAKVVEIQGAENNKWMATRQRRQFIRAYDKIAHRMNFRYQDDGNWLLRIQDLEHTEPEQFFEIDKIPPKAPSGKTDEALAVRRMVAGFIKKDFKGV